MSYTVVDKIPSPFLTLSGKNKGPAVSVARLRGRPGDPLYLHLDELRDIVVAVGWMAPTEVAKLQRRHVALVEEHAEQAEQLAAVQAQNDALRAALVAVGTPVPVEGEAELVSATNETKEA